jgi:membrane-associated protease RseP (regulator of RpoE activity)
MPQGAMPRSAAVYAVVDFLVFPSVFWALFNLLPVLPLDSGKIAEELIRLCFGGTQREALVLSIIVAAAVALWGFRTGNVFLGIFFVSFAFNNYEMLQSGGMRRPW